jgi:hypothetical protein
MNIRNFDDIKVSTKTFTAHTNISIDLNELFDVIEVVPYDVPVKKRGRKKKGAVEEQPPTVPYGSIVTLQHEGRIKGVSLKTKTKKKSGGNWFRNSITIVVMLEKPLNFKVSKNGTFQMTGCKTDDHPEFCVKMIWDIVRSNPSCYDFKRDSGEFTALIVPAMRNIDFGLGFNVDRDKLSDFLIRDDCELHCLMEPLFGSTSVNIKIPLSGSRDDMEVVKICQRGGEWVKTITDYREYLSILDETERKKKIKKQRYNTFLVFHSGAVIFSGLTADLMRDTYYDFMRILGNASSDIIEKLRDN